MPEQSMAWKGSGRCLKERVILKNTHLGLVLILLKSDLPFALSGRNVVLALKTFGNIAVKVNMLFIGSL